MNHKNGEKNGQMVKDENTLEMVGGNKMENMEEDQLPKRIRLFLSINKILMKEDDSVSLINNVHFVKWNSNSHLKKPKCVRVKVGRGSRFYWMDNRN